MGVPAFCLKGIRSSIRLRNIRVGKPSIADKLHIGEVVRFEGRTLIHNLGGRNSNTLCSTLRVGNAHREGGNYFAPGCAFNPPLPRHVRIVYIDAKEFRWCSVDSVAFHSFAWPRNAREAKSIVRTLFTNYCKWPDVLVVRGRCFSTNKVCFRASRVLKNLLWNLSQMGRPYVVYREGSEGIGGGDPMPSWLLRECVYKDFCQCKLVSRRREGWHYPGALCSNIISRRHLLFEGHCGQSHIQRPFLIGCDRNTKNVEIATRLSSVVMHVLIELLPSVPQRGVPLVSAFTSRNFQPKWDSRRLERLRVLRLRRILKEEDSEEMDWTGLD